MSFEMYEIVQFTELADHNEMYDDLRERTSKHGDDVVYVSFHKYDVKAFQNAQKLNLWAHIYQDIRKKIKNEYAASIINDDDLINENIKIHGYRLRCEGHKRAYVYGFLKSQKLKGVVALSDTLPVQSYYTVIVKAPPNALEKYAKSI